jgi:anti-sigma factor RsiW
VTGSRHLDDAVLADYLEGLLAGHDQLAVDRHLAGCEACATARDRFTDLRVVLGRAGTRPAPMPPALAARLDAVLAAEVHNRTAGFASTDVSSAPQSAGSRSRRAAPRGEAVPRVSPGSRARHRRRAPRRTPRLLAAAAGVFTLAAAGVGAYLVFGTGVLGPGGQPEAAPESSPSAAPRSADNYAFKNDGPADLSATGFADQVSGLVGPGSPASEKPKELGTQGEFPNQGVVSPTNKRCVTMVLKDAKAGNVLDLKDAQLDGRPVVLAITSARDGQVVRVYAVRGCPGMYAEIAEAADVRVR